MLSYKIPKAIELLATKLKNAKGSLQSLQDELEFLRVERDGGQHGMAVQFRHSSTERTESEGSRCVCRVIHSPNATRSVAFA